MPSSEIVLGLGSNLPFEGKESRTILEDALAALGKILGGLRHSSFYETEPQGPLKDQANFINCAAMGHYKKTPEQLLEEIHKIETAFGRNRARERRFGERTLDIDILLFGDLVLSNPQLEIPHPRLKERRFALEPLLELSPNAKEPGTNTPYREICDSLPSQGLEVQKK